MAKRDRTLDYLRCLAMLWVIVVHVIYWGTFFGSARIYALLSLGLFEMPLFFFITGASNSFGREERYFSYVYRRFRRILVPYWVFGTLCGLWSAAAEAMASGITLGRAAVVFGSWLIPWYSQITSLPYLKWIVWFVPVYLAMVLALPGMKKLVAGKYRMVFVPVALGLFAVSWVLDLFWVRIWLFYSLWTYLGLFYRQLRPALEDKKIRRKLLLGSVVCAVVLGALLILTGEVDLQSHKFPPTPVFMVHACAAMCLILSAVPAIDRFFAKLEARKPLGALIRIYSQRSTTIFLYQTFVFSAVVPITRLLISGTGLLSGAAASALCLALAVPGCALAAKVLGGIESWGTNSAK